MWLIPLAVFVLAFAKCWNVRESLNETVWFGVAYMGALGSIYLLELAGIDFRPLGVDIISTSWTGAGGLVAMLVGFLAMWVQHKRWRKAEVVKKLAREEAARQEAERRAAQGLAPAQDAGVIAGAFRFAGAVNRARKSTNSQSQSSQ
jgi:hypothetical protein